MVEANLSHQNIISRTPSHVLFSFCSLIGLDKLNIRAKGINHPKYSVEAEYACLTRKSATS